ncbi:uncharacterized protein LOC128079455 isoform X2 [Tympanuchus pallidicinctus]|uniref:uncharacterized protein LOC128079455 isoform X2 n=1 Tax=Tympanuchus pallidicinctus TaxID=109042 RepID=UPI0022872730|nr:uncharacterized protein LOC128079455 isoform X2 [Tympanuchus pallidicinctus]
MAAAPRAQTGGVVTSNMAAASPGRYFRENGARPELPFLDFRSRRVGCAPTASVHLCAPLPCCCPCCCPPPGCCGGDAALRRLTEQNPSLSPAWTVPPPPPSSGSMTTIATVATALTNLGPQPAPVAISTAPTLGTDPRTSPSAHVNDGICALLPCCCPCCCPPPGCCGGDAALRRLTEQNPSLSPAWTVPPPPPSSGSVATIATVATALTNLGRPPAPMAISTAPTLGRRSIAEMPNKMSLQEPLAITASPQLEWCEMFSERIWRLPLKIQPGM